MKLYEVIGLAKETGLMHAGSNIYKTLINLPRVHNGVDMWKVWDGIEIVENPDLDPNEIAAVKRSF